jgi:hypothetical protein
LHILMFAFVCLGWEDSTKAGWVVDGR